LLDSCASRGGLSCWRLRQSLPTRLLRQSPDWARQQKVLSWEPRGAIGRAQLQRDRGRIAEASDLLTSVYGRFDEGSETIHRQATKNLQDKLHSHCVTVGM
jgi:hypothetical protein